MGIMVTWLSRARLPTVRFLVSAFSFNLLPQGRGRLIQEWKNLLPEGLAEDESSCSHLRGPKGRWFGEVGRRLMHLVPAPAVRLMKRRVQSRPGARPTTDKPSFATLRAVGLS